MPHLNMFISHRHEDYKIAKKFREEFERISGPACTYFLAEEIRKGDAWRRRIVDTLDKADWLILLFTDPSQNWGWCMFEAGQFEASILKRPGRGKKERRLICIHSPQVQRPDPLEPFQAVFASPDDLVSLVREFAEIVNPIIFKRKPDLLYEIAGNVCEQIKKPEVLFQSDSLTLTVLSHQNPTRNKIPPTAIVRGDHVTFRELFALLGGQFKWQKVETAALKKLDTRWLPELTRAVHAANNRKNFGAIQAAISNHDSTRYYRPVIRKVTSKYDGSLEFEIDLIEYVGAKAKELPPNLAVLLSTMAMTTRLRYEFIKPFLGNVKKLERDCGSLLFRERFRWALFSIIKWGESRGISDKPNVLAAFYKKGDRKKVELFFHEWEKIKRNIWLSIGMVQEDHVFTEFTDNPLGEGNIKRIESALNSLEKINIELSILSSERFANLIRESHIPND